MAIQLPLAVLLLGTARADPPVEQPEPELRAALGTLNVRRGPDPKAALRGRIQEGAVFQVIGPAEGPGCETGGWGQVAEDAYVCLTDTAPSEGPLEMLPRLVDYPVPTPEESDSYTKTGAYTRREGDAPLLPFIYGKRGRRGAPPLYASAAAYEAGEAPVGKASASRGLLFVGAVPTARGEVLVRQDGQVVPADSVLLYAVDRFQGRDLLADPLPEGHIPGWATATKGLPVFKAPEPGAEVGATLPYHAPLVLLAEPADREGRYWTVPDGLGPGVPGYVEERGGLRHVTVVAPPEDAGDLLWLDVDLSEQVLMAWQGGALVYATLVSTGKSGDETPTGLYRIGDKAVTWDMASLDGSDEPYYVEQVPYVAHFAPRYALHGVFWHWSFGNVRSHGCVNLAPRDARAVFELIEPTLRPGWEMVYESPAEPGTLLRVRFGARPVKDRRAALR